jgi:hypothetical protein
VWTSATGWTVTTNEMSSKSSSSSRCFSTMFVMYGICAGLLLLSTSVNSATNIAEEDGDRLGNCHCFVFLFEKK